MSEDNTMSREALKRKLYENGSQGLDMSPGDPIALEALKVIGELEQRLDNVAREYAETRMKLLTLELATVQPINMDIQLFQSGLMKALHRDNFDDAMKVLEEATKVLGD